MPIVNCVKAPPTNLSPTQTFLLAYSTVSFQDNLLFSQVLLQMQKVHRRTFVYLITFMKNMLECSEINGLEPKVLGEQFINTLWLVLWHGNVVTSVWFRRETLRPQLEFFPLYSYHIWWGSVKTVGEWEEDKEQASTVLHEQEEGNLYLPVSSQWPDSVLSLRIPTIQSLFYPLRTSWQCIVCVHNDVHCKCIMM